MGVSVAEHQVARRLGIRGALVIGVSEGSAAAKAGIRPTEFDSTGRIQLGDIIVAVDDKPVESRADLVLLLRERKVGDEVRITVERGDRKHVLAARLQAL